MIAEPDKSTNQKLTRRKGKIHPNSLKNLEKAVRFKPEQVANPEGLPKIKTNANYWRNKYLTFTKGELQKELNKSNLKAVQIACLRDVFELMREPKLSDNAWNRLKEVYQRDEPIDSTPPMPNIHITIVRE